MARWRNWARTVDQTGLEKIYNPGSRAKLQADVNDAAKRKLKLRVVGSGHAWSNLGVPRRCGGAVLKTDKLTKFLKTTSDSAEVEAGITVRNLNNQLFKRGLALANMGDSNPQAIAGAIATETHGSGVDIGSISEFVEGMQIVKADGALRDLNTAELKAGRVALGLLGAVYSVKLRVRERFYLEHWQDLIEFRDENLEDLLRHRHLEYWYYPYTGKAERIIREETDSTEVIDPLDLAEEWYINAGAILLRELGEKNPEKILQFLKRNITKTRPGLPIYRRGPSHKILLGKSNVWRKVLRTYTMEYQFPLGAGLSNFWDAFQALEDSIELAGKKCVFVASPIQIRFTKKSTGSLLTHLRHQPTASFSISLFRSHKGVHTWLPDLERRLRKLGGLPHWGKMYYEEPKMSPKFEEIRAHFDPTGIFNFRQGPYQPDPEAFQDP